MSIRTVLLSRRLAHRGLGIMVVGVLSAIGLLVSKVVADPSSNEVAALSGASTGLVAVGGIVALIGRQRDRSESSPAR